MYPYSLAQIRHHTYALLHICASKGAGKGLRLKGKGLRLKGKGVRLKEEGVRLKGEGVPPFLAGALT